MEVKKILSNRGNFIDGPLLLKPNIFNDKRGYFFESFNQKIFETQIGKKIEFIQDNQSKTKKNVIRGLHFQTPPFAQSKLVRVLSGKILDVAVDLRPNSSTFKKYFSVELSSKNKKQLFVPRGFAHGFLSLENNTIVSYKVDNFFSKKNDSGFIFNDPEININWSIDESKVDLSLKDKSLSLIKDLNLNCFSNKEI